MTPDPYHAAGGPSEPQSWNRYAYTRGDPTNRNDPSGLCDSDDPSCVSQCDPADPICVIANECDPADASCSLGSVGGSTGGYPFYVPTSVTYPLMGASGAIGSLTISFVSGASTFQFGNLILTVPLSAITSQPAPPPGGGYWAYVSCFLASIISDKIQNPQVTGVSLWALVQGSITGAAWGPGAVLVGGVMITVDLNNAANQAAHSCAKLTGYTPWVLQN